MLGGTVRPEGSPKVSASSGNFWFCSATTSAFLFSKDCSIDSICGSELGYAFLASAIAAVTALLSFASTASSLKDRPSLFLTTTTAFAVGGFTPLNPSSDANLSCNSVMCVLLTRFTAPLLLLIAYPSPGI